MVGNGHTLVELLSVCCSKEEVEDEESGKGDDMLAYGSTSPTTVPMDRGVHDTEALERREKQKRVLQKAMIVVVRQLQTCEQKGLAINTCEMVE